MKNFINKLFDIIKNFDKNILKLIKLGLYFCFILCIISVFFLFTYESFYSLPILFYTGYTLLKASLMFGVTFFICGISFDKIKKELNF